MNFPLYLSTKDITITVKGAMRRENNEKENGVFLDGKGYLDENNIVWIYSGDGKPINANKYPYFWLNSNGEKEFSNPLPETLDEFSGGNLVDASLLTIVNNTKEGEELYNEQAINDMNSAAAIYVPIINDNDDFLKKVIKNVIIEKNIDISRLKYKMGAKYGLPNMKAALQNKTKMSVNYFLSWAELLGIDFTIAIEDNGTDTIDPLKEPLFYVSSKDQVIKNHDM